MACLKLGFPNLRPIIRSSDIAETEIYNPCGIISGFRHNLVFADMAASLWFVDFDFGINFAPNYLFIAKLALTNNIVEIGLERSTDNITFTGVWSTDEIEFQGNNNQDFFVELPSLLSARYWRVAIALSPSTKTRLSKVYLGNLFEFEKDVSPSSKQQIIVRDKNRFETTSGRTFTARSSKPLNEWSIVVKNVSDSNAEQFFDYVLDIEKRYIVLVDSNSRSFFNGQKVWHGIVSNVLISKIDFNLNNIEFLFRGMA